MLPPAPLTDLCFLLFAVLFRLSLPRVRPRATADAYIYASPQTPIDSCNFHLSAAAAAATTTTAPTTAIKMVTPNPGPTSTM